MAAAGKLALGKSGTPAAGTRVKASDNKSVNQKNFGNVGKTMGKGK